MMDDVGKTIAITGMGCVLPTGLGPQALWDAWQTGKTGITAYKTPPEVKFTGMPWYGSIPNESSETLLAALPKRIRRFATLPSTWGLTAAAQALQMATEQTAFSIEKIQHHRRGLFTAQGDMQEVGFLTFLDAGRIAAKGLLAHQDFTEFTHNVMARRKANPFTVIRGLSNNLLGLASLHLGWQGDCGAFIRDSQGSIAALQQALLSLKHGYCDAALVITAGSFNDPFTLAQWAKSGTLNTNKTALRYGAYEASSQGIVLGEGACALLLERVASVEARGASALAMLELPLRQSQTASSSAYEQLLKGQDLSRYDLFCLDGRGCPKQDHNDLTSLTQSVKKLPALTSTRSLTGVLGAAGLFTDIIALTLGLQQGHVPSSIQYFTEQAPQQTSSPICPFTQGALIFSRGLHGGYGAVGLRKG